MIVNGAEVQEDKRTARPILVTDKVIIKVSFFFLFSFLVPVPSPYLVLRIQPQRRARLERSKRSVGREGYGKDVRRKGKGQGLSGFHSILYELY